MNGTRVRQAGIHAAILMVITALVAVPVEAAKRPSDGDITAAIETNLWVDQAVPSHNIDVEAKNGIVRLTGSVYNILARERATAIAENVRGVRSVVNEIEVKPVVRSDEEIQADVTDALRLDPATNSYAILAKVADGTVTLSGTVDSYPEKRLSEEVAKGVRGVRAVKDNIELVYEKKRSDREIEEEVEALLKDDVRLDGDAITVKVKDGKVSLSGVVDSAAERALAGEKAWVAGVRATDVGAVKVDWWARDRMRRESASVYKGDEEIEKAVKDAFTQDPRVWPFDVKVETHYAEATLTGAVDNLEAKKAAEQDAKNTLGVWRVEDHLKVRPNLVVGDSDIIANVSAALRRDPYVDRYDINVSAENGKAYLYGAVDSEFDKARAEDVASRVKGVVDVENLLDVREAQPWKSDRAIKEDVQDQLYWDGLVDEAKVDVSVEDGVASLSGTVDTWYQYTKAAEDARAGGAREIRNDLHVRNAPPTFQY
jgi:osmotically-inducible protein OsmY